MSDTLIEMQREINRLRRDLERFTSGAYVTRKWIYPSMSEWVTNGGAADTPLTSTSWDGDARSTTAKTKIDLSSVFGAPAGIKAVLLRISAADSGSASGNCSIGFSPNDTAGSYAVVCKCTGRANDDAEHEQGIVPCDAAGDIYFQCTATGSGTLDVITEILGYLL